MSSMCPNIKFMGKRREVVNKQEREKNKKGHRGKPIK
jgi:hypothetical protein